ncbi:MAG: DNA repair protein RecO [Atopobiaceae bacterium]|nr:DNA repair protein RecO [Atopobiaceae bacterium]
MARRPAVRYRALVLGRTKLAEQDIIVTLLTSEGEQLRAVAKGGRKPGSRLAARTELFVEAEMLVSPGRGLGIITEAEVVDAHPGVRGDVERVACGSAMCEVARLTSYEDVEDPFMFHILRRALHACEQAENRARLDLMVAAYVLKVVSHGGWRPVLDVCVACGEPMPSRLCVRAGGVLCESCARDVEDALPISTNMIAWIAALVGLTFDNLLATSIDGRTAAELLDIAHRWAATHLEARLRAMEFLRGI